MNRNPETIRDDIEGALVRTSRHARRGGPLSRRLFLGGAGALVGLPVLEALAPRTAAAAEPVRRFFTLFMPCGFHMPFWRPEGEGNTFTLGPTMQPLAPYREKLNIITGLRNQAAMAGVAGDHSRGTGSFLTCAPITYPQMSNGVSLDQVMAGALGSKTLLPSLPIGMNMKGCDLGPGYSCAYIANISWDAQGRIVPKIEQAAVAYEKLFAGLDRNQDPAALTRLRARRKSVLDYVNGQLSALRPRISQPDQRKLDQYTDSVRDLEKRLDQLDSNGGGSACKAGEAPTHPNTIPARLTALLDVAALALQCDATRVVTFMMGGGGDGGFTFPFLDISGNHHPISHHQRSEENFDKLKKIDLWEMQQLAYLLAKLDDKETADLDGKTLLDNTALYVSSEVSDGDRHNHDDLPVIVLGGCGGRIKTGRHIIARDAPLANLYVSFMQAMGMPNSKFGMDGTGPLAELA